MEIADILVALDWAGRVATVLFFLSLGYAAWIWFSGVGPALWRLGNGLARRKIAVLAKGGALASLEAMLLDSKLFRKSNIIAIADEGDIGKAESATLFLVHWPDWPGSLKKILARKTDGAALIVYAPQDKGQIPPEDWKELNIERNVVISNVRGRLLNDIVTSMITTSYEKV